MLPKLKIAVSHPEPDVEEIEGVGEPVIEQETEAQVLARENAELKEQLRAKEIAVPVAAPPVAAPTISSHDLEAMSEEQREKIAEQVGLPFEQIVSRVKTQERAIVQNRETSTAAKGNIREAIDDLTDRDPQAGKLKRHIREYFDGLPDYIKADPAQVNAHMKRAVTYAKGSVGFVSSGKRQSPDPSVPGPNDEPIFDTSRGDEPPSGMYSIGKGVKIRIGDMPKNLEKSPERNNGVRIKSDESEWDEPVFR